VNQEGEQKEVVTSDLGVKRLGVDEETVHVKDAVGDVVMQCRDRLGGSGGGGHD